MNNDLISRSALLEAMENKYNIAKEQIEDIMNDESIRFAGQAVQSSVNIVKDGGI